jgi:DNA-binding transcriptional regulator YiaG
LKPKNSKEEIFLNILEYSIKALLHLRRIIVAKKKLDQEQVIRHQIGEIFIEFGNYLKGSEHTHFLRAEESGLDIDDLTDEGDLLVGGRIKSLRKEGNLSQLELAVKLEVSQAELSKLESGKKILSISRAKLLAEIFKSSVEYILTGKKMKPKAL